MAYIQSASQNATAVNSATQAFPSNVTAGNFKVVIVSKQSLSSTLTVSDNLDGSYTQDLVLSAASDTTGIFSKANATGGATTVTFTGSGSNALLVDILEFSGVVLSSPTDQTGSASHGTNSATLTIGPSGTTTQASELIVAGSSLHTAQTATWGSGFASDPNANATATLAGSLAAAYKVVSAIGSQSATVTPGGNAAMTGVLATYFLQSSTIVFLGQACL